MATVCTALLSAFGCDCAQGPVGAAAAALPPRPPSAPRCCLCMGIRRGAVAIGALQLIQASLLCAFFMCLWLLGKDYDDLPLHILCAVKALHNAVDAVCDAGLIMGILARRRGPLTVWMWATAAGLPLTALPGIVAPLAAAGAALVQAPPAHLDDATAKTHRRLAAYAAVTILVLGVLQTALSVHFLLVVRRLREFIRPRDLVAPAPTTPSAPLTSLPRGERQQHQQQQLTEAERRRWRRPAWEAEALPEKVPPSDEDFVDPLTQLPPAKSAAAPVAAVQGSSSSLPRYDVAVCVEKQPDPTSLTSEPLTSDASPTEPSAVGKRPPTPAPKRTSRRSVTIPPPPPGSPPVTPRGPPSEGKS